MIQLVGLPSCDLRFTYDSVSTKMYMYSSDMRYFLVEHLYCNKEWFCVDYSSLLVTTDILSMRRSEIFALHFQTTHFPILKYD